MRSTRGIDVKVTLRALPFTPPVKLYLLNRSEALFGYHTVKKREGQIAETATEIYDALGSDSVLFPFEVGGGTKEVTVVTRSQAWFDGLWGTIATEITLGRPATGSGGAVRSQSSQPREHDRASPETRQAPDGDDGLELSAFERLPSQSHLMRTSGATSLTVQKAIRALGRRPRPRSARDAEPSPPPRAPPAPRTPPPIC
ncbi:hypothetical protein [Streptomyces sp. V1I1]|uniref:hypothetical protein n=1 Tax=Streptomyces sp. V1I1 TaxID=3042272 RepID=UPI0027D807AC|nr:hypothetical protein [Streptomyces sp. V1I1]